MTEINPVLWLARALFGVFLLAHSLFKVAEMVLSKGPFYPGLELGYHSCSSFSVLSSNIFHLEVSEVLTLCSRHGKKTYLDEAMLLKKQ
jgi:hypothetical protein